MPDGSLDDTVRLPRRRSSCLGRLVRWTVIGLVIVFLLSIAGSLYEATASAEALRLYPAPGQLVNMDGYHLHLYCTGQAQAGRPVVILEAGALGSSLDWSLVQPEVAQFARVCAYDRAGLGWSEPGPEPRDAQQLVEELHTLLANSGEQGPYVLVGASFGGLISQTYASRYPDEVAGLVLVDSLYGDLLVRLPAEVQVRQQSDGQLLGVVRLLAQMGGVRLADRVGLDGLPESVTQFPAEVQPVVLAVGHRGQSFDAAYREVIASAQSLAQARQAAGAIPPVPLIVLSHGVPYDWLPAGVSLAAREDAEQIWQARQAEMARSVPEARLVVVEGSGHAIALERPEAVVEAVREVVEGGGG
ncbi:MAG: alpha/beta hydrolase [Chloroflexi bacterium]|nr:alpha/beta hydrolase [Chloroflexota bacterium]MCI0644099.1 alpha/beta hydrolase [Chloroflexota bacterium]